jgi:hypothetical protein
MHRTQVLLVALQCVFTPVVHVVSSMQATHVLVVVARHTVWFMPPPPPRASGKQLGLSTHSTQYPAATLQKGSMPVHCESMVQAVTHVCVFRLHAVPPSPQLAFDRHRTHVLVAVLQ